MADADDRGPSTLVVRGPDGEGSAKPWPDTEETSERGGSGIEKLLESLASLALESTGQQLLEAVDASFDLFDESTRNALAIKAAAEQHTNDGGKGFLALAAAVKVATERHMEACGERLRKMIAVSRGDAKMLRSLAESYARKGQIDNAFLAVVDANLEVARTRNEPVKVKVLTYLRDEVLTPLLRGEPLSMAQGHDASASGTGLPARGADASMEERLGRHHAPQFTPTDRDEAATTSETDVAEAPIRFLNCSSLADALAVSSKGGTKGAKKRAAKEKAARMAQEIGRSLGEEGWAVMDEFLSLDDIRGVRAEMALLDAYYRQSEIWVGKEAGVGAQISVPSVRGDRVLWMCGGHTHAAGVVDTRDVAEKGSVEPCDHSIARKIGKARFHNLRDAMRAVDALVDSLRQVTPRLTGIGARSDCMLAVYPGEGARFQRHVDNTAKDGRVLTAVLYLSGGAWDRAHGGQLRVFPRPGEASEGHGGLRRRPVDVFPDAGRLVLFYSDEIPHEVLPTHTHRYACTVWYYDKEEREAAVARAKEAGIGVGAEEGKAAHKEATEFVRGMVSTEGIASEELASRAEALSAGAARIVGAVLGAGRDSSSLGKALRNMDASEVASAQEALKRMGI